MKSITYKNLTIISCPRLNPDQKRFDAMGSIRGIHCGDGSLNKRCNTALATFNTEQEAEEYFFDVAKKYIDDNELGRSGNET